MAGFPIEEVKITHEDLVNQLVKQLSTMTLEMSVVRAENEKLRKYVGDLLTAQAVNEQK